MPQVLFIVLTTLAVIVLIPASVVFCQVLAAVTRRADAAAPSGENSPTEGRPSLAILMPAHNEQALIADSLRAIMPQLAQRDRLLVVADNCSDATASIAASLGAEVIERHNAQLRGKGYALDFGMSHLSKAAPEVVIIVDADCQTAAGSIERLARQTARSLRPVQSLYLMQARPGAGLKMRIAEFAWIIINQVRPLGMWRLGLPCQLMGTGMAFPWATLSTAQLATGHLVEDRRLGTDLTCAGKAPLFCPQALVTSYFPSSSEGIRTQRTRWEHGSLGNILSESPRLLKNAITTLNVDSLALALDISVPPLALMALILMVLWSLSALFFLLTRLWFPLGLTTCAAVLFATAILLAWQCHGKRVLSLGNLMLAILQAFLKVPLYFKFLVARQSTWVRSKRDGE